MDSREKFAQMLREGYEALDPEKEQREYIRELLRRKEQQRKRRIKAITAIAAAFLIVVGAVLAVGGCFGAVEADKNDRTKVEEHNGSAVIKGENTEDEEIGPEVAKVTDWDGIAELKEQYPEMITFTDVPEGMEFVSVEVKEQDNIMRASYCYIKQRDRSKIYVYYKFFQDEKQETYGIDSYDKVINYKNRDIYISEENNILMARLEMKNSEVDVIGATQKRDIFNIIDKIKEAS